MADVPESLVDRRVIERNIAKGLIEKKDYEKHLESLPDVADNAAEVELESGQAEQEGDGAG
ncbi:MAG: hypothetical protein ACOCUS_07145 [Polyangiales bacterium]